MTHSNTHAAAQCSCVSLAFIVLYWLAVQNRAWLIINLCFVKMTSAQQLISLSWHACFWYLFCVAYRVVQVTYTRLEHTPLSFLWEDSCFKEGSKLSKLPGRVSWWNWSQQGWYASKYCLCLKVSALLYYSLLIKAFNLQLHLGSKYVLAGLFSLNVWVLNEPNRFSIGFAGND